MFISNLEERDTPSVLNTRVGQPLAAVIRFACGACARPPFEFHIAAGCSTVLDRYSLFVLAVSVPMPLCPALSRFAAGIWREAEGYY